MAIDINSPTVAISVVPTVQSASYSTGNVIGGLLTFAGATRNYNGGLLQSATATFGSGITPALDLILFNASPTGSTTTDKVALAIVAADLGKVVGVLHLTDATNLGSTSVMQSQEQAVPFDLAAGTITGGSLFGVVVTRATAVLTSVTDITVTLNILQN